MLHLHTDKLLPREVQKTQSFSNIYLTLLINCSFGQKPTTKNFGAQIHREAFSQATPFFSELLIQAKLLKSAIFALKCRDTTLKPIYLNINVLKALSLFEVPSLYELWFVRYRDHAHRAWLELKYWS